MMTIAAIVGRFIGAVLAECGPVLAEILRSAIRDATNDTVETGERDRDLRARLLARLRDSRDSHSAGGAGAATRDDP